jgi:signal transduction histidine kinase
MTSSLVDNIRLRAELGAALREVRDSRTRLIQVGNAERRRLERDLHDGAQQRLVALGMALRVAQLRSTTEHVDIDRLLDVAMAELGTAVAELRQIAHGLRPTSLDDGLHAALTGLVQSMPIPVDVDIAQQSVPDDIATTAYYVACEALTNAAKHADAQHVVVQIRHTEGELQIRIEDDGQGGATIRPGTGLAGLQDRVRALGGSMSVRSPASQGTVVEAVLPCAS